MERKTPPMIKVSATEFQRNICRCQEPALTQPLAVPAMVRKGQS